MKRIVWIAVTVLIMLAILGFGLHTLNNIDEVNKRRREKEAGQNMAPLIAMTTATTSIWDKLRETTETATETDTEETQDGSDFSDPEAFTTDPFASDVPASEQLPWENAPFTEPTQEVETVVPDMVTEMPQQSTTTVSVFTIIVP